MTEPQTATANQTFTERTFDESGQTVEEVVPGESGAAPDAGHADPVADAAKAAAAAEPVSQKKYRIGDQEFATQEEALAYANSQTQIADAYSQGLRDALSNPAATPQNVTQTPPKPELGIDPQEMYTNPEAFLQKYATKIKTDTITEISQSQSLKAQSDAIWGEFTSRHPELADFRTEVENYVQGDTAAVRALISTKGRPASYDYIATKIKSRFEAYGAAVKPKRELPNTSGGASPAGTTETVTPKTSPKKPLSFSEQVASIRKRR
jgi:flagellar hook-length control protein FliK